MKYLRVKSEHTSDAGDFAVLENGRVRLLEGSPLEGAARKTGVEFKLSVVREFLPPVEPPNIIAIGLNYAGHAAESGMSLPEKPVVFLKATTALSGHMKDIVLPASAPCWVDYEGELAVVIGKKTKNVEPGQALNCVFGYTCGNDVTARDCQQKYDAQWARAKSFDSFAPVGPVVETDIDPSNLLIITRLNGSVMQEQSTSDMIFSVPELISYLSRQMTLLPGTLIMTGTPAGIGYARSPRVFLSPGDLVEVEIERVGCLSNTVRNEPAGKKQRPGGAGGRLPCL